MPEMGDLSTMRRQLKCILWFAQENVEFRAEELQSIVKSLNISMVPEPKSYSPKELPYWIVEFPDESEARKLASRSVSIKSISELWGFGNSYKSFHADLKENYESRADKKYFDEACEFKMVVETYNKHFLHKEKVQKMETLDYLPFRAPVNLKSPKERYLYFEYYGLDLLNVPEEPLAVLFGRWIVNGQRDLIQKISLKTRKFIGNTSMDPALSILMANQCAIKPGDVVLDPFVGTGSLLISAALFGAFCYGSDIDFLMLHGKTRPSRITQKKRDLDERVSANFAQYGLESQYLDVFVADFSQQFWKAGFKFDAIVTDPPYGIRESTERIKTNIEKPQELIANENLQHYSQKCNYELIQLVSDLMNFAAKHLNLGGRLVFWMPFYRADYQESLIPRHNSLQLIANSEQVLSTFVCRRLLTFEKTSELVGEDLVAPSAAKESYEFDFRERYFKPMELTRKERRQIKYDYNLSKKKEPTPQE